MCSQTTVENNTTAFVKNPNVNYEIKTFLEFKDGVSRSQDYYGAPILKLIDSHYLGKAYKTTGCGYDMHGTNLGNWLQDIIKGNSLLLEAFTIDLIKSLKKGEDLPYGLYINRDRKEKLKNAKGAWNYAKLKAAITDKAWSLDGACGESCMKRIAELVGINVKDQYQRSNRKGKYDKFLGCIITLTEKNTYRKLCAKNGVRLYE